LKIKWVSFFVDVAFVLPYVGNTSIRILSPYNLGIEGINKVTAPVPVKVGVATWFDIPDLDTRAIAGVCMTDNLTNTKTRLHIRRHRHSLIAYWVLLARDRHRRIGVVDSASIGASADSYCARATQKHE
jgi:hypothetical protein